MSDSNEVEKTDLIEQSVESTPPTDEQLRRGYFLKPEEVVELPVQANEDGATELERLSAAAQGAMYTIELGKDNPMRLRGKSVGVIYAGNVNGRECAEAMLIVDDKGNKWISLNDETGADTDVYSVLDKETPFVIGREFPGQEDIGSSVSREHCAVSLNDNGDVVVKNLNPTNSTGVKSFVA